jgi:hypothetical protein
LNCHSPAHLHTYIFCALRQFLQFLFCVDSHCAASGFVEGGSGRSLAAI